MYYNIERKYLKSISKLIQRTDVRTIRSWCKKTNLMIYKDSSGEFVYRSDFELAYDRPLILKLKEKYGVEWSDYYSAYQKGELVKLLEFSVDSNVEKSSYIPKGKISNKILKK